MLESPLSRLDRDEKLIVELNMLREINELDKKTKSQLETQYAELKEKLDSDETEKQLKLNSEIEKLSERNKELEAHIEESEKIYQIKIDDVTGEKREK